MTDVLPPQRYSPFLKSCLHLVHIMSDDNQSPDSSNTESPSSNPNVQQQGKESQSSPPQSLAVQSNLPGVDTTTNRTELFETARAFLRSPQVVHEDSISKRRFLAEKGLNPAEIDSLLQELVSCSSYSFSSFRSSFPLTQVRFLQATF